MGNLKRDLEQLKRYRETNERKSREVVQIWDDSISSNIYNLGKEKHIVLEQVSIAAADSFRLNIAQRCIQELYKDFPNSSRVRILESMVYEADENYPKALQILNDIIKQDNTNSAAKKRRIAIFKALGRYTEAIKELTEYLKTFMADVEAWQELSELYINEHDYSKAAFCVEELILHNPHNHLLHQRYADIKYTQGGLENLEIAKSYYYQALRLNSRNIRALYGIYLTTTASLNSQKNVSQKKKDSTQKVIEWSLKQIRKRYADENEVKEIEESLAALEV
ncbi:ER membrane protein complex subunit 2-like [Anoplophora glabripennis]|uniref:ER membrane protein complex subunit 2-like n=1 Tax=Anoplophora glabripennis TaxID=217634 RepID=UPI00087503B0|nr:ER membrane protein complex subunit 2-like [Anoplophora glabripennis]